MVTSIAKTKECHAISEHVLDDVACNSRMAQDAMVSVHAAPVADQLIYALDLEASVAYEPMFASPGTLQYPTTRTQRSSDSNSSSTCTVEEYLVSLTRGLGPAAWRRRGRACLIHGSKVIARCRLIRSSWHGIP